MITIEKINNSFELPDSWEKIKIKFLLDTKITDGPHETPKFIDEGIPFLSVDSIVDGKLVFDGCRYISEEDHAKYKLKCFPRKNDVFMGKAASIGKIAIVDVDFEFSIWSPLALLRPNKEKILPKFLEYSLKSDYSQDQIDLYATSNTQKNISMDDIPRIELIVPNLDEQLIIVNYLDKKTSEINGNIKKNKELISLLEEKKVALINKVVTKGLDSNVPMKDSEIEWIGEIPEHWECRKINSLSSVRRGASPRPIDNPIYFDDNGIYSWVRISNVTSSNKYLEVTDEKLSTLGKSLSVPIEPGNIFVSIAGTVGKPIIANIKCCIHDGFVYFKDLQVNDGYLFYIFEGKEPYKGLGKLGTQLNLNTETIGGIYIPVPPKNEQILIENYLDTQLLKLSNTIEKIQKNIDLLEEYKSSLIHHVVTGKIDVRDEI